MVGFFKSSQIQKNWKNPDSDWNLQIMRRLISAGADLDAADSDGETPLHKAAKYDGASTGILIDAGARLDVRDPKGRTPLHYAANYDAESTILLVGAGADPFARDNQGLLPIDLSCEADKGRAALVSAMEVGELAAVAAAPETGEASKEGRRRRM